MKSTEEIQSMLVSELFKHIGDIESIERKQDYYNQILGDTSFLLAGLLETLLKMYSEDWDNIKWIDDSLITDIEIKNKKFCIWGIMIWGKEGTTEQWTDPFYFEIDLLLEERSFKRFTFLFCDLNNPEISYEYFKDNRNYWADRSRDWKYIINST